MKFKVKKRLKLLNITLLLMFLITSFSSAELILSQNTKAVYNIGDSVIIPVIIKSSGELYGIFQVDLICNQTIINFYKNGVKLSLGEEKTMDSSLVLIKEVIGDIKGNCKIKATLNEEYILTNEFKISNLLNITTDFPKKELDVGELMTINARAIKESSEELEGIVELKMLDEKGKVELTQSGTVTEGNINLKIPLSTSLESKEYKIEIVAYEKDSKGIIINQGSSQDKIFIKQMPTNLELITEEEIEPEKSLKIKSILRDQTGKPINSSVIITIKDFQEKVLEQKEILNGESIEYLVNAREPPLNWKISAVSKGITSEEQIKIKEKEKLNIEVVNKTLVISNEGNVPYNNTLLVRIDEIPLNIQVSLKIGESKTYVLTAPNGEYNVRLITNEGEEITQTMSLTGKAISIKEKGSESLKLVGWFVLILILILISIKMFKKLYKKSYFTRRPKNMKKQFSFNDNQKKMPILDNYSVSMPVNKAELSLSIKGTKQEVSGICLKIKNLKGNEKEGSPSETIKKIIDLASDSKAVFYENQDYLIFLFAPLKTKTMRNEVLALNLAEKIQSILIEHNKNFNQKLDFGLSLNNGTIVGKVEDGIFKFMAIGLLMTTLKKISSVSNQEILLSQEMNELLILKIKSSKEIRDGTTVYILSTIKKEDEETTQFINKFLKRQKGY